MRLLHPILFNIPLFIILSVSSATAATYTCDSCISCSSTLNAAQAGDIVELTADISSDNHAACVDFGSGQGVIFDGKNHTITQISSGYRGGVYISSSNGGENTIKNLEIRGFSSGINIWGNGGNTISSCRLIGNNTGVRVYGASDNTIENSVMKQNFTGIYLLYDSDRNIIRNSFITKNHSSGITFYPRSDVGDPEDNQIYNNIISNATNGNINFSSTLTDEDRDLSGITFTLNNTLNTTLNCSEGANIMGCGCHGGNYWELPFELGFSQTCADGDENGICDTAYSVDHPSAVLTDSYPLSMPTAGCCTNKDRDGDGYDSLLCGGQDIDDDPMGCGTGCYPDAPEVCDGFDNNYNGITDDGVSCQDLILYKDAYLPRDINDQSCVEVPEIEKIFCFGGSTHVGYLDTIVQYDPVKDQVQQLSTKLPTVRSDITCNYSPTTERIYCFGGYSQITVCNEYSPEGGCISATSYSTRYNEILEFNPHDNSLLTLGLTLPVRIESMGSAWSNLTSTIFLFGGTSSVHSGNRDWILEFDPVAQTLRTSSAVLPSPYYGPSCAPDSSTGKIYCFGGYGKVDDTADDISAIVEYNPATDSLRTMATSFQDGINSTPCVEDSIDNLIYCFGGRIRTTQNYDQDRIIVYNPRTDSLSEKSAKFIQVRYGHACVENRATNKIYCFGGASNVVNRSEIAEYTPYLPIKGDLDVSGTLDLADLIKTLQLNAGISVTGVNRKADIGGNRQLGLEEAVFILHRLGGL